MKIAMISNLNHRNGDLIPHFYLRAIHYAGSFLSADLLVIEGNPGDTEELYRFIPDSLNKRKIHLPTFFRNGADRGVTPEVRESLCPPGNDAPDPEEILRSAGPLPDFSAREHEIRLLEWNGTGLVSARNISMVPERIPGLTDFHIHTPFAYCSENMNVPDALRMANASNVDSIQFSEHSGQLYFSAADYWPGHALWKDRGTGAGFPVRNRMDDFLAMIRKEREHHEFRFGFELDVDADGNILLEDRIREQCTGYRLGAVHFLENGKDYELAKKEFLFRTEALLKSGIEILAHPFRVFRRKGFPIPQELFEPVSDLLRQYGTAAEINYHTNDPEEEFFVSCAKKGVKISLGSDSHNLYETAFFLPHIDFLKKLDLFRNADEILLTPDRKSV